jgi:polyisoprenoid-binding protein YceI
MRALAIVATAILAATAGLAAPLTYRLDPGASAVSFVVSVGNSPLKGTMPVSTADLLLDFDQAAASRVDVVLSPVGARMGLPFATEAMKGPDVLAVARYPEIRFVSTRVRADGDGATVEGDITIRGVTRPITLAARLYRPEGSQPGHRKDLTIRLTGAVSRAAFGATGFAELVGDDVRLDITARILLADGN